MKTHHAVERRDLPPKVAARHRAATGAERPPVRHESWIGDTVRRLLPRPNVLGLRRGIRPDPTP